MMSLSGVLPSPHDGRDYFASSILKPVTLPSSVRMDDKFVIRNQGFCGTCVGKASSGLMSAKFNRKLSSLYIYALCKQFDGIPNQEGTYPRTAMQVMKNYGACLDESLPYVLNVCTVMPAISDKLKEEGTKRVIKAYARAYNLFEIKQSLAAGHLVALMIQVGDNFIYYQGGVMGPAVGTNYGYHLVVLCGYEEMMVRGVNSWGESWGEKGFFWFANEVFSTPTVVEAWIVEIEEKEEEVKKKPCAEQIKRIIKRWKSRKL